MIVYGNDEIDYVAKKDSIMELLVKRYGHLDRGMTTDVYTSIVFHIISQMLSNSSARAITSRFIDLVNGSITPQTVRKLSVDEIRSCGISKAKAEYILSLSKDVINGTIDLSDLKSMTDDEVIEYLIKIKGIGKWTAEMIACFTLGRLNIFCYEDVALCNGIKKAHGYKTLSRKRFERIRKKYSPYCSVAAIYYYEFNDDKKMSREELLNTSTSQTKDNDG